MYQYGSIVAGYEFDFNYPEPARTFGTYLSVFGFEILNVAPPEVCRRIAPLPSSDLGTRHSA